MGFPMEYTPGTRPQDWVPTNLIRLQQAPLLPDWARNRPFAMPSADADDPGPHPDYDEPGLGLSQRGAGGLETSRSLTDEQKLIARFWSDDPMLTPTPAGHWIAIVLQIAERDALSVETISPRWRSWAWRRPMPSFPAGDEVPLQPSPPGDLYQATHRPRMGAASDHPALPRIHLGPFHPIGRRLDSLTAVFGENFAFDDETHVDEGLPVRSFPSFAAAAEEAAASRLYGGIHFRFRQREGAGAGPLRRCPCGRPADRSLMRPFLFAALASTPAFAEPVVPTFTDETATSGLATVYDGDWEYMVGGGVATFDCSGDRMPEVFLSGGAGPSALYLNRSAVGGALAFEKTDAVTLDAVLGAYPLDIDSDGIMDLVVLRLGENRLLRGLGIARLRMRPAWGFDGGDAWSTAFAAIWEKGQSWPTLAIGNYVDRKEEAFPWGSCTDNWLHRPDGDGFAPPIPLTRRSARCR
jgi:hypothetical protein